MCLSYSLCINSVGSDCLWWSWRNWLLVEILHHQFFILMLAFYAELSLSCMVHGWMFLTFLAFEYVLLWLEILILLELCACAKLLNCVFVQCACFFCFQRNNFVQELCSLILVMLYWDLKEPCQFLLNRRYLTSKHKWVTQIISFLILSTNCMCVCFYSWLSFLVKTI